MEFKHKINVAFVREQVVASLLGAPLGSYTNVVQPRSDQEKRTTAAIIQELVDEITVELIPSELKAKIDQKVASLSDEDIGIIVDETVAQSDMARMFGMKPPENPLNKIAEAAGGAHPSAS